MFKTTLTSDCAEKKLLIFWKYAMSVSNLRSPFMNEEDVAIYDFYPEKSQRRISSSAEQCCL